MRAAVAAGVGPVLPVTADATANAEAGYTAANSAEPAKKGRPAASMNLGVAPATPCHRHSRNSVGESSISEPVTRPVHIATSPITAE